jgi:hypothetical protein
MRLPWAFPAPVCTAEVLVGPVAGPEAGGTAEHRVMAPEQGLEPQAAGREPASEVAARFLSSADVSGWLASFSTSAREDARATSTRRFMAAGESHEAEAPAHAFRPSICRSWTWS